MISDIVITDPIFRRQNHEQEFNQETRPQPAPDPDAL
jgi:hypothetical protein